MDFEGTIDPKTHFHSSPQSHTTSSSNIVAWYYPSLNVEVYNKHPDLAPPPYTEFNEQLADIANVPPSTEANVDFKDGVPVFSKTVMMENLRVQAPSPYGKGWNRDKVKCPWQHCNNLHTHRHFWAEDVYKYPPKNGWPKAFDGLGDICGWEGCTWTPKGHWHEYMPDGKSHYLAGMYAVRLELVGRQKIALAHSGINFPKGFCDAIIHGREIGSQEDFKAYGWMKSGVTDGGCNAAVLKLTWDTRGKGPEDHD